MQLIYLIIFFILGTYFGSFYTVIGLRLPKHIDFIKGRSHCDNCKHDLSVFDLVPIISYVLLRGKCRYCGTKISPVSTYMEIFCGVLFALSYYAFGLSYDLLIALGIVSLLIILSVSDLTYMIIPDEVLIFFSGYFIIINTLNHGLMYSLFYILSGFALFFLMYFIMRLGNFIFKKESLGGGDIKLMFVIGLVLHPFLGLVLLFIASFIALPVSFIILLKKKQNIVPFGPFLLTSFALIYFTKIDMNMVIEWIRSL